MFLLVPSATHLGGISSTKGKAREFADRIRREADIPVIFVGQVNTENDVKTLQTSTEPTI
jgi:2,4-dienoyl-CoA reductase-like NADH-dependent reductase (Old Yellow Enzyme family)